MMSGNPFELQFNVVKLDKTGSGEMIQVSFYPGKAEIRCSREGSNMYTLFIPLSDNDSTFVP